MSTLVGWWRTDYGQGSHVGPVQRNRWICPGRAACLGDDLEIVSFCEMDPFCQKVLKKHWPDVPIVEDVCNTDAICSLVGSPVKTLATLAVQRMNPKDLRVNEAVYGEKCLKPFAWYDHAASLWRTFQLSLGGEWEPWSETWPRSGMTQNGMAYQLAPLVPLTSGIGSGLWPTQRASDANGGGRTKPRLRNGREVTDSNLKDFIRLHFGFRYIHPALSEWMQGLPAMWTDLEH